MARTDKRSPLVMIPKTPDTAPLFPVFVSTIVPYAWVCKPTNLWESSRTNITTSSSSPTQWSISFCVMQPGSLSTYHQAMPNLIFDQPALSGSPQQTCSTVNSSLTITL